MRYYENLYSDILENDHIPISNILGGNPNILSVVESHSLEGEIAFKLYELNIALSNMKNNKSPGSDGYTVEFLKLF